MSVASVANQMCAACARSSVCKLGRLIMTQKSDFMDSVRCYQKQTAGNQQEFFAGFVYSDDLNENFRKAWDVVRNQFYSFGRLATFSYLEYLRIMRVGLDCDQLFLEDMSGSKSHRNGLAKVLGRDDLDWHNSNPTKSLTFSPFVRPI